jgi:hypothetical protein
MLSIDGMVLLPPELLEDDVDVEPQAAATKAPATTTSRTARPP